MESLRINSFRFKNFNAVQDSGEDRFTLGGCPSYASPFD